MNILIENYKNITKLNYDLEDNKINYLFGISGSGKSSIPNAIVDDEIDNNRKFGSSNVAKILIDGNIPQKEKFIIFNDSSVRNYFDGEGNDYIYPILIDDDSEYSKAQKGFINYIFSLEKALDETSKRYDDISSVVNKLGATSLKKDNTLKSTSQLYKMVNSIDKMNGKKIYSEIESMQEGKFEWVLKGIDYVTNNRCPFCNKKLSYKLNNKLERYSSFDLKSCNALMKQETSYEKITGESVIHTSNAMHSMVNNIVKMSLACQSYLNVRTYLEEIKKLDNTTNSITKVKICEELYDYFPELKRPINNINNNIDILKQKYSNAAKNTSKILNKKTNYVNKIINKFGIPYKIMAKYNQKKINEYKLVHIDDLEKRDSRSKLSTGEKNIVSLIFFLLTVKRMNDVMIIIDDPVSSYDECRRKVIFDLIVLFIGDKTTLLLSHDYIFAKYAALKVNKYTGSINYLENFDGNSKLVPISKSDFGDFHDFILERLKSCTNYYTKIINIRMLYEGKNSSNVYQYLSALLHCTSINKIKSLLLSKNIEETEILEKINENYRIELEPMFENYYKNINTDELSFFEKALFLREYMKYHNINKQYKSELDGFIHLNSRLLISLNPYKYAVCTPMIYQIVSENINGILKVME